MIIRVLLLAVIAGGACGTAWYTDIQRKERELKDKQKILGSAQRSCATVATMLAEVRQKIKETEKEMLDDQSLLAAQTEIKTQLPELRQLRESMLRDFVKDVQAVRAKYLDMVFPEVRLADGRTFSSARFQAISDNSVRITHAGGLVNLEAKALSSNMRECLRIDMFPMKAGISETAPRTGVASSTPPPTTGTPQLSAAETAQRVSQIMARIREYEQKISGHSLTKDSYLKQVENYRIKDVEAVFLKKEPKFTRVIPQIDAATTALVTKIAELNTKLAELKNELERLTQVSN